MDYSVLAIFHPVQRTKTTDEKRINKSICIARLRDLGDRSGKFCVCKLIVSTYAGHIGAIHRYILAEPATSPSKLMHSTAARGTIERKRNALD